MSKSLSSRLEELWADHEHQWLQLENLECHLDENARQKHQRIANLLNETPTHRRSQMQIFVLHKSNFMLIIEGKLLIGHLDHTSVDAMEQEAAAEACLQLEEDEMADNLLIHSTDQTLFQ